MNQEIERQPQAGDVWWVSKVGGAQDLFFVVQTFEKIAITLKLIDKEPRENGVRVGGMWVDVKMLSYTYYTRFDTLEGGPELEALGTVKKAIYQAIDCGGEIPEADKECIRLKNELTKIQADREAVEKTNDAVIDALRDENIALRGKAHDLDEQVNALKAAGALAMEESKKIHDRESMGKVTELTIIAARATKEAEIYKELYKDLLEKIIPKGTETPAGE